MKTTNKGRDHYRQIQEQLKERKNIQHVLDLKQAKGLRGTDSRDREYIVKHNGQVVRVK